MVTGSPVTSGFTARSSRLRSCIVFCTKPALTTTVSPLASRVGMKAQVPGPEISSRTAEPELYTMASGAEIKPAMKRTRRNSSLSALNAFHCEGGGSASGSTARRSVNAAIKACFSTRRCSCHRPRVVNTATITSVKTPKPRRRRPVSFISIPGGPARPCDGIAARSEALSSTAAATASWPESMAATAPREARTAADIYLHDQRASDDDRAGKHDDEDSGSVAGVDERVIQSTDVTLRPKREEAGKQLAVAAAWAPAAKPSPRALQDRRRTEQVAIGLVHDG